MNFKKMMLCLMLLITITGLIVPVTAASGASYKGSYEAHYVYKNGKKIENKIIFEGEIYLVKSSNRKLIYYTSSKKKLKAKINKISQIVLMIKKNGKYKVLKVIKKPKNGWKITYSPYVTKKGVKKNIYTATITFEFKSKGKLKKSFKGNMYLYNSKGKKLYKKTHFRIYNPII